MKFYNLSNHGALTGCLLLIFFIMMAILAASRINELEVLTVKYKDFQEYPPLNGHDLPIAVLVVSSIMIVITGLMIVGIVKEHHLFMAPWLIICLVLIIGQVIYYVNVMLSHFKLNMIVFLSLLIGNPGTLCLIISESFYLAFYAMNGTYSLGVQILIISPILILFDDIRCKNNEKRTQNELNHLQ